MSRYSPGSSSRARYPLVLAASAYGLIASSAFGGPCEDSARGCHSGCGPCDFGACEFLCFVAYDVCKGTAAPEWPRLNVGTIHAGPVVPYQPLSPVELRVGRWNGSAFLPGPGPVIGVRAYLVSRTEFAAASSFTAAPWRALPDPVFDPVSGMWTTTWTSPSSAGDCGYVVRLDMDYTIGGTQMGLALAVPASLLCYADCDQSGSLDIDDFLCFINEFAQAQLLPPSQQQTHYANCTGATSEPYLSVDDFLCFINAFAAGCP